MAQPRSKAGKFAGKLWTITKRGNRFAVQRRGGPVIKVHATRDEAAAHIARLEKRFEKQGGRTED